MLLLFKICRGGRGREKIFPLEPAPYSSINKHLPLFPLSGLDFALKGRLKAKAGKIT